MCTGAVHRHGKNSGEPSPSSRPPAQILHVSILVRRWGVAWNSAAFFPHALPRRCNLQVVLEVLSQAIRAV